MKKKIELKKFIECPACKTGHIVHSGDHYYCTTDNRLCNFMIRSDQFGAKITKTLMQNLIKNRFIEPMYIGLNVYKNSDPVNGFIVISKHNRVEFIYPNYFPLVKCPKCKKDDVIMKYNGKNESLYYGCKDWKNCGFTLPYIFRNKPFKIKDIKLLCSFETISKTYKSKNDKAYTVNVYLDNDLKIKANL